MNKKIITFFSLLFCLILPLAVLAVEPGEYITSVLQKFLNIILWPILLGGAVIMLVFSGFMFITAAGDPGKVAIARKAFLFVIIGLIIGFLAFSVVDIIRNLFPDSGSQAGAGDEPSIPPVGTKCVAKKCELDASQGPGTQPCSLLDNNPETGINPACDQGPQGF